MKIRPASEEELKIWHKWLNGSHGLKRLPGAFVSHVDCGYGCPLLLTRWKNFKDFKMRLDRDTKQPIMSFSLRGKNRTIATYWFNPVSIRLSFSEQRDIEYLTSKLMAAAAKGRIWWGIECPPQSSATTSVIFSFPKRFPFPPEIKSALQIEPPVDPLQTSLELV